MYFSRNVFMSVYHVPLLSLILIVFLHVFIFQKVAVNVEEQNRLKFAPKLRTRRFGSRLNGSYKDCFFNVDNTIFLDSMDTPNNVFER